MKKSKEENTVSVLQKAISYFNVPVTEDTIKESLKAHSHYPSLKSVCDVLSEWKIENYPLKYSAVELNELKSPFIAHFGAGGGSLVFVSNFRNGSVTYYESKTIKREIPFSDFAEKFSGAAILMNPDKNSGEKDFKKNSRDQFIHKSILPLTLAVTFLFVVMLVVSIISSGNFPDGGLPVALLTTKTAGIILSMLLVFHEYEIRLKLTDKLCHLGKVTDCNTVLNAEASRAYGWIGWADIGLVYFTGTLLILLQSFLSSNYSVLSVISTAAVPYTVFSVYYQGFKIRKWCPLCLGVQLLLITEFLMILPELSNLQFSFNGISSSILILSSIFLVLLLLRAYLKEKASGDLQHYKYLGLRKKPDVIKTLLLKQKFYDIPDTEHSLLFGSKDTTLRITAFLSLNCSHCARSFIKIKNALKSGISASFNIILVTDEKKILNTLYHLNRGNKEEEALVLLDQWYNAAPYSRYNFSENYCIPDADDVSIEVGNENSKLFKECNVIGTPSIFVNGYKLPSQYDIDDLKYFSEVFSLIDSETISKIHL